MGRPSWRWGAWLALVGLLCALPALAGSRPAGSSDVTAPVLLDRVRASAVVGFTAYAESTSSLPLPDVDQLGDLPALLGGTTRTRAWWRGPDAFRVDALTLVGEVGTIREATGTWTWISADRLAGRVEGDDDVRLPRPSDLFAPVLGRQLAGAPGLVPSRLPVRRVAGRAAPGLRLTPALPAATTVRHIDLWVEEQTGLPLRVEVVAAGREAPSLSAEVLDLTLGAPAEERVRFVPPDDATVVAAAELDLAREADRFAPYQLPARLAGLARSDDVTALRGVGGVTTYGEGLGAFAVLPVVGRSRRLMRATSTTDPDRGTVVTPLVNVALARIDGQVFVASGTVPLPLLERALDDLARRLRG
ncbi:MAG: hypothetical protein Q8R60_06325 [Mycobacteriales bacterium]|nr:hypothetical protein [Mycobacteriales bacterium]